MKIEMVDLGGQYHKIQPEIDCAILKVIKDSTFINGPAVEEFTRSLSEYLNNSYVIPCANGTDALQVAMMALGLEPGDEVIVPAFTYVATAEVIALLQLKPVMVDVDPMSFNIKPSNIEQAITTRTKAIVPVHLFGQCADMESILQIAKKYGLFVIEDSAQALGAKFIFNDGEKKYSGTIGDIGCTSFFPSKNLGCYGDGGAVFTRDSQLAEKIKMITNHGQEKKYIHKYIGVNSRLDSIQAAILNIKLKYFNEYINNRITAAGIYDELLGEIDEIDIPFRNINSTHVFHQYTITVKNGKRDSLKKYLERNGIPAMIYYPISLNEQEAYKNLGYVAGELDATKMLCSSVLSLPMHTELSKEQQVFIVDSIRTFFKHSL